jgi:hypothetical protein
MKSKYKKSLSIIMILVILVSHSIIPVSASSDYYESTYNGYNYDCYSEFTYDEVYGEISYAGTNKLCVDIEYLLFDIETYMFYSGSSTSAYAKSLSWLRIIVDSPSSLFFEDSNYTYSISPNAVYFVGLS